MARSDSINLTPHDIDRFHTLYEKQADGCWLWKGATNEKYGRMYIRGVSYSAIGVSLAIVGRFLPGRTARHTCNNPLCVNPAHLEHGIHRELLPYNGKNAKVNDLIEKFLPLVRTWLGFMTHAEVAHRLGINVVQFRHYFHNYLTTEKFVV